MARYFVRLKVALTANNLRSGWRRRVGLILGLFVCFWVVIGGFATLANPQHQQTAVPAIFDAFFVAWLCLPLLGLGSDETLDPSKLALLPLTRRQLMTGLLCASLVGLAPVATLLTLTGTFAGSPGRAPALALTALAIAIELVLCVVGSRALTTALSSILRSRRGKDLLGFAFAIVAVMPFLASQVLSRVDLRAGNHGVLIGSASKSLSWLPPGWAAKAVLWARSGDDLKATGALAAAAAAIGLLLWFWSAMLQRALTTAEAGPSRAARKPSDLFGGVMRWLPRTRTGAVAAKELRYTWRDPRRRAALVTIVLLLAVPATALAKGRGSPRLVFVAAGAALVFALQALNQFGSDGPAFWTNVAAARDPAIDFRGKNLASALLGLAVASVAAVLLGALLHAWSFVLPTIFLAASVSGVALGVANQVSVLVPFPLPDSMTNLWAGPGCLTVLASLSALVVIAALLTPVAVAVGVSLALWPHALVLAALAAAAYGAAIWRLGLAIATRRLRLQELPILEIVSGRAGA
ncbi:MAG TPA: hypothetical protein VFW71_06350 [Actinomycetota bacterium]|nr:hypothetical protein [Actinomycetota bacterium]